MVMARESLFPTPVVTICTSLPHGCVNIASLCFRQMEGSLVCIFQSNEERGGSAQATVDGGLYSKCYAPIPDVVLGQHVVTSELVMWQPEKGTA
jgi:metal-dependent amidase/aminoacylase/carboxypeptidase family protein